MPKYRVNYYTGAYASVIVEAEDEDAAREAAPDLPGLCAYCTGYGQEWTQEVGDWEPVDSRRGYNPEFDGPAVEKVEE